MKLYSEEHRITITKDEDLKLARAWQKRGDLHALDRLLRANIGLVMQLAHTYRARSPQIIFDDLVQQGMLGLVLAAAKGRFDPERGLRFPTYATHWARAMMDRLVFEQGSMVKFGTTHRQRTAFWQVARAREALERAGAEVTTQALADEMQVQPADVERALAQRGLRDLSLDQPLFDDSAVTVADRVASAAPSPEEQLGEAEETALAHGILHEALAQLDEREKDIIRRRYLNHKKQTLAAIGKSYGTSRERVRQLESRALKKLRVVITHKTAVLRASKLATG